MGGIKKGRGKDKKKRKPRKGTATKLAPETEPEVVKPNIIRNIINVVSEKIKKETHEPWSLDIGPPVKSKVLGRHVFKDDSVVEIDLGKL